MKKPGSRGFTLIELLVAIAIFALMSGLAYRGLSGVLDARQKLAAENQKWRDLVQVIARMEADFTNAIDRPIKDSFGADKSALIGAPETIEEAGAAVVLTRGGLPGHSGIPADLQRVGYRLRDGRLEQLIWPALDQPPRAQPAAYVLLDNVAALELRYLDAANAWQARWPLPTNEQSMPRAVEVQLSLTSGESVMRLFVIAGS